MSSADRDQEIDHVPGLGLAVAGQQGDRDDADPRAGEERLEEGGRVRQLKHRALVRFEPERLQGRRQPSAAVGELPVGGFTIGSDDGGPLGVG
jgi:hypothetical protein